MPRSWAFLRITALSFAGVVGGHLAAYLLVEPDPHARSALLERTGHGSWSLLISVAAWLAVAAAVGAVAQRWRGRPIDGPTGVGLFLRLATLQAAGFVGLELVERLQAHGTAAGFLQEPAVLAGLALQILFALISPRLLELFVSGAIKLLRSRPVVARARVVGNWHGIYAAYAPSQMVASPRRLRAPPRRS